MASESLHPPLVLRLGASPQDAICSSFQASEEEGHQVI